MLDTKDFTFFETQNTFDFKIFFTKILGHWKWFLISLLIAFTIAYQVNIRKEKIYGAATTIAYKEEKSPFFTSNTSLIFNWGGTSDQVQMIMTTIKSRSHNERVVRELDYYIDYLRQGEYNLEDAYGEVPFYISPDENLPQLQNQLVEIAFTSPNTYEISINFEQTVATLFNYQTETYSTTNVAIGVFKKQYKIGEQVNLPFLHCKIELGNNPGFYVGSRHNIRFQDFNSTVKRYQGIGIDNDDKAGAILVLNLQGTNKARMVDYLNGTVTSLMNNQLQDKNQFATNTIKFIDSTLLAMEGQMKNTEDELKNFSKGKNIFELEMGGGKFSEKVSELDLEKDMINRKLNYYNTW